MSPQLVNCTLNPKPYTPNHETYTSSPKQVPGAYLDVNNVHLMGIHRPGVVLQQQHKRVVLMRKRHMEGSVGRVAFWRIMHHMKPTQALVAMSSSSS